MGPSLICLQCAGSFDPGGEVVKTCPKCGCDSIAQEQYLFDVIDVISSIPTEGLRQIEDRVNECIRNDTEDSRVTALVAIGEVSPNLASLLRNYSKLSNAAKILLISCVITAISGAVGTVTNSVKGLVELVKDLSGSRSHSENANHLAPPTARSRRLRFKVIANLIDGEVGITLHYAYFGDSESVIEQVIFFGKHVLQLDALPTNPKDTAFYKPYSGPGFRNTGKAILKSDDLKVLQRILVSDMLFVRLRGPQLKVDILPTDWDLYLLGSQIKSLGLWEVSSIND